MSIESLNHAFPREVSLQVGQRKDLTVLSYPSTGYLPFVSVSGVAVDVSLGAHPVASHENNGSGDVEVGGAASHCLTVNGVSLGHSMVVVRFKRPWVMDDPEGVELELSIVVQ